MHQTVDIRDAPADVYTSKLSAVEKICKSILGIEIEGGGGGTGTMAHHSDQVRFWPHFNHENPC